MSSGAQPPPAATRCGPCNRPGAAGASFAAAVWTRLALEDDEIKASSVPVTVRWAEGVRLVFEERAERPAPNSLARRIATQRRKSEAVKPRPTPVRIIVISLLPVLTEAP
jgi:hypothetical protein